MTMAQGTRPVDARNERVVAIEHRQGVDLAYGAHMVLRDISLDDRARRVLRAARAVRARGKTTLLRLIAGFNRANAGAC